MPITINGSGTVTGISAGGLPDGCIQTADVADANITAPKLSGAQSGSAPVYGCRAWVNFDGTRNEADTGASTNGANVKIRASGNVASVLKNGTGDYTITFTTAMPDANYCCVDGQPTSMGSPSAQANQIGFNTYTTTSVKVTIENSGNGTYGDKSLLNIAIFR
jgi:hypothetical protein